MGELVCDAVRVGPSVSRRLPATFEASELELGIASRRVASRYCRVIGLDFGGIQNRAFVSARSSEAPQVLKITQPAGYKISPYEEVASQR
jgi:hypothetical protein